MYNVLLNHLKQRENSNEPIRVAVAGLGFIGRGLVNQSAYMPGIVVSVIYNRNAEKVTQTQFTPGINLKLCSTLAEVNQAIEKRATAVVTNPHLLFESHVDIVMDTTGDPEFGAWLCYQTILSGKHIVATPEMDVCIGPYLKKLADDQGVVYSLQDGEEPSVAMSLFEYVSLLGFEIIAVGKFKNYTNPESNPDTVKPWSDSYQQNPYKIASFADGTKMSIEMGTLCNATGFLPDVRGLHCPKGTLFDVASLMRLKEDGGILNRKGVVEIVQGVNPLGGVYVVATTDHPQIVSDLSYYKMGPGPNYLFYRPYHLCSVEILVGAAACCINHLPTLAPAKYKPYADVAVISKKALKKGERLDSIGGYCFYGALDSFENLTNENYLPVSIAEGGIVTRDIEKGQLLTINDVDFNQDKFIWKLRTKMIDKLN